MHPFLASNLEAHFRGKKVLLGITGSIAAFKAIDLIRLLKSIGATVRAVPTRSALEFITIPTLETISGEPVVTEMFGAAKTHHIDTARWADRAIIMPATANFIGKMSFGLADDLLSTELLAFTGPVAVVPAMNPAMFAHAAVRENIERLRSRGISVLGPTTGLTACGEDGEGRMLEPEEVLRHWAKALTPKNERRAVITLGPTRSALDPVRYLTNHSSGQMGAALAWEAFRQGYALTVVAGPCEFSSTALLPPGAEIITVISAEEMANAALAAWARRDAALFVAAAAVLDWDVIPQPEKIKKDASHFPQLRFKENRDILKEAVKARRPGTQVLGFAAETGDLEVQGAKKLLAKGCDYLFANDVSQGQVFNSVNNVGLFFQAAPGATARFTAAPQMSKVALSSWIFERMEVSPASHHLSH